MPIAKRFENDGTVQLKFRYGTTANWAAGPVQHDCTVQLFKTLCNADRHRNPKLIHTIKPRRFFNKMSSIFYITKKVIEMELIKPRML